MDAIVTRQELSDDLYKKRHCVVVTVFKGDGGVKVWRFRDSHTTVVDGDLVVMHRITGDLLATFGRSTQWAFHMAVGLGETEPPE